MMTAEEFWEMADSIRTKEEYLVDDKLRYLQSAPVEHLRDVFVQYRFFTIYYIGDLALLVHKVPFGHLRSVLGEILNDAGSVGLRLREQSRSQTKAFDRQPWIPDGLGDGKSSLQGGQPTLRFPVPHEGLSIARMKITHLHLARPQMHPAFHTGLYQADGLMRFACACQRGRQCSGQVGVDGIVAVAFDNLLAN